MKNICYFCKKEINCSTAAYFVTCTCTPPSVIQQFSQDNSLITITFIYSHNNIKYYIYFYPLNSKCIIFQFYPTLHYVCSSNYNIQTVQDADKFFHKIMNLKAFL
jgi:hypothetical protein